LRGFAAEALRRRNSQLLKVTTPESLRIRQTWARETFWGLIGGAPERTPLNTRVTGEFDRPKYKVQKLVYESRPGEWISANLYLPKSGAPPYPGVLFQMGHSPNGKAADTYQRCCQGLVQLGFVVLAFDPMGQGERTNYPGPDGLTRLASTDLEHTVPGRQMLLAGDSVTRMQTWDAVRSLDMLAAHALVDPKRLASTGQSGGATITMLLAAVDDRLAAAAVSSGNIENVACTGFLPPGSVDDAEQNLVGSGVFGFDRWDLLWPFAPKPLLILTSAKDTFGTYSPNYQDSGLSEYARLKDAYRLLGRPEHLGYIDTPLPHGLSYSLRLEIYRWLRRWLQSGEAGVKEEPPVSPEPDQVLFAGPTGNVVRDFASKTPVQTVRERVSQITPSDQTDLYKVLGMPRKAIMRPVLRVVSRVASARCEILAVEVQSAPQVWIPAWIFVPKRPSKKLLVVLEPSGRNSHWHEDDLYQRLADDVVVCAPDLRGIGDLRPEVSPGAPDYEIDHESDENYAWGSLIFGKSLLGQRVTDLIAFVDAVTSYDNGLWGADASLAARGHLTVPALCAASLLPGRGGLYLAGHLVSWRSIVEFENYEYAFSNFVPNAIRDLDLAKIAGRLASRKVIVAGAVDGSGRTVSIEKVRIEYPHSNVEVQETARWDASALLSF
jgi:cephalosporin-C deacetylase-like acetyl esterase